MLRIILGLVALAAGAGSAQAADCNVPFFKLLAHTEVTGHMYVKAGKSCSIQSANAPGGNTGIEIRRRPSNGQVQLTGGFKITYQPRPGFVGKDSFAYARKALESQTGRPVTLAVNVLVTVEP
jgi:hypothetical protein